MSGEAATSSWSLEELGERVRLALAEADYAPAASGRVRAVPDGRTIRYYTTLGLIDRPGEFVGRVARYGPRHLLQLVAIKRLQAEGLSLAQVQERLAGIDSAALERLARLPDSPAPLERSAAAPAARPAARADFWAQEPAPPAPAPPSPAPVVPIQGLALDDDRGVTLLLPGGQPLTGEDILAIQETARPLLDLLAARGLLPERSSS